MEEEIDKSLVYDQIIKVSSLLVKLLGERTEKIPQNYQGRFVSNTIVLFVLKMCYCMGYDQGVTNGVTNGEKIEFLNEIVEKLSSKKEIRRIFEQFDTDVAEDVKKKQHVGE
jgi:ABC-type transport system involved in cytochrome c biogenesis ATPase subunit